MDDHDEASAEPAAASEHSGLLVTALLAATLVELAAASAVAGALGLSPVAAVVAGVVVTLGVSCVAAVVVGAALGLRSRTPSPAPVGAAPEPVSLARRDALELVEASEARLLRAVEVAAPDNELMACALDVQGARLRLARVLLTEDGELPRSLQDELLVAHRGTSAWLRSPRLP